MKILVTGATGMVGKNLLEHPKASDYALLFPDSKELNLLNDKATLEYLQRHQPEMIIHCAGIVGGIQANIKEPFRFLNENTKMGLNLIEAAKTLQVPKMINLGSSCMYPRDYKNPLREEYILQAELEPTNEGYALAKILCAKLCEYITRENSMMQYKTLIPCNLYGRWDKFDPEKSHMIPAVIRKIHEAKLVGQDSVEIWGDGLARREFMYSRDLIDFIYYSIENHGRLPQNLNVGVGQDYSINEYYNAVKEVIDYRGDFNHNLDKPTGMKQKLMDSSKAFALGWRPKHNLQQGIAATYEFFKNEVL